jgi:hypothetical protein
MGNTGLRRPRLLRGSRFSSRLLRCPCHLSCITVF